jgi:PKD repeat protein
VTLNLTIHNTTYAIDTIVACDSLTWINGITYYANDTTAKDTLVNAMGCDSIVSLYLTINNSTFGIDTVVSCESYTWMNGVTYFTSNNTDTHTLVNAVGCDSIVTLNLTVSNLTANYSFVNNGSGNYTFTNLSSGNFTNTHWGFGDGSTATSMNVNHTFNNNGTYVVVLAIHDSNVVGDSCISYFTDTLIVTGASNTTQCNAGWTVFADSTTGGVAIVNSSTGSNLTYHWDFGDGDTSNLAYPTHTYAANGPYNLCLTVDDGSGCSDTYCDSITANGVAFKNGFTINVMANYPLSIQDLGAELEVNIYPNPTSSQLTIETKNFRITKIQILDNSGKVVKTITSNFETVNVEGLATGIYHLELIGDDEVVTRKIIKQ